MLKDSGKMRKTCSIMFVFTMLALLASLTASYTTQQKPDKIIYKGKEYRLSQTKLRQDILLTYLKKEPDKWSWLTAPSSTALWKGYTAIFEVVKKQLVLKDIRKNKDNESSLKKFLSVSDTKGSKFKVNWFTDVMVLEDGAEIMPIVAKRWDLYESYLLLEFENGILKGETRMGYMEYMNTYVRRSMLPKNRFQEIMEELDKKGLSRKTSNVL